MPRVEQGVVTEVGFLVDSVTDISPLNARKMTGQYLRTVLA